MNEDDRREFGPGIQPSLDNHPQPKTDKAERDEQKQFANYCLLNGYPFVWHGTHKRSTGTVGCPDFIVGINGSVVYIEFKRDYTCKLSSDQEDFGHKLEAQGLRLYVVYSSLEAIELLKYFDRII